MKILGIFFISVQILAGSNLASAQSSPHVDLFYGKISDAQREVLKIKLEPSLEKTRALLKSKGVELRFKQSVKIDELIQSLSDPTTLGSILIGHPALSVDLENKKVANAFLIDSEGRYIPKNIFTAAHAGFKFFGLVSCHLSALTSRYQFGRLILPEAISESPVGDNPNDVDQAFFELTPLIAGPLQVLAQVEELVSAMDLGSEGGSFPNAESDQPEPALLKVRYRDLYSPRFTYTVTIDDHLIGTLQSGTHPSTGLRLNEQTREFKIPPALLANPGPHRVTIRPDDARRPRLPADPLHLIDDVLVDQVSWTEGGTTNSVKDLLIGTIVHLGDDTADWDREIRSYSATNDSDFGLNSVRDVLELFK